MKIKCDCFWAIMVICSIL